MLPFTNIRIKHETARKLRILKQYDRETYDEIINKLIKQALPQNQEVKDFLEDELE